MVLPPDPLKTVITLIELGKHIRERYKIYTHAGSDLGRLDSQLISSLFVLETFKEVIEGGLKILLFKQQQDIISLFDHLQGVFDRYDCLFCLVSWCIYHPQAR
jgi:hypothetical protein